jgi:hypothetical protein
MAVMSPNSNPDDSALPKGLIGFDHSIEIWLAEVAQVSRPAVVPTGNNSAKRKGGPRNVVQLVLTWSPATSFPSKLLVAPVNLVYPSDNRGLAVRILAALVLKRHRDFAARRPFE